mgnify:CR=1 FL=1
MQYTTSNSLGELAGAVKRPKKAYDTYRRCAYAKCGKYFTSHHPTKKYCDYLCKMKAEGRANEVAQW